MHGANRLIFNPHHANDSNDNNDDDDDIDNNNKNNNKIEVLIHKTDSECTC